MSDLNCRFMTSDNRLLALTEQELWAILDEIRAWRENGRPGELNEPARIVLETPIYTRRCSEIFELWQLEAKGAVC
jgi:hypothetical protein